jgi:hypothetical protein
MADISSLKNKKARRLGPPPGVEEASNNLTAPEVAPAAPAAPARQEEAPRIDARSLRRSNRTVQFATRVTPEWDARIRAAAQQHGLMLTEVLERALDAFEREIASR